MKSFAKNIKEKTLSHSSWLYAAGIFFVAIAVYLRLGLNGALVRDNAFNLYLGQMIARGIPHYVGVLDFHTPLAPMVIGGGSYFATSFGLDQILTVRVLFLILSALTVTAVYFLGLALFKSNYAALFAALIFMSFPEFALSAAYGPQAKSLMVLFQVATIYHMTRKSWFWAGFFASLAFLVWQPYIIMLFAVIGLAYLQSRETEAAGKMVMAAVIGCLTPLLLVFAYFLNLDTAAELIDLTLFFPFRYLEPARLEDASFIGRLLQPLKSLSDGYQSTRLFMIMGFGIFGAMFFWRYKESRQDRHAMAADRFLPILITFPAPIIWSMLDFQGPADFFPFLPYLAIAMAWFCSLTMEALSDKMQMRKMRVNPVFILLAGTLLISAYTDYLWAQNDGLQDQRDWAERLELRYLSDPTDSMLNFGGLDALVLLERTNPNPFVYMFPGVMEYIEETTGESLENWFANELQIDPSVVFLDSVQPKEARIMMVRMLREKGYRFERIGEWRFYAR